MLEELEGVKNVVRVGKVTRVLIVLRVLRVLKVLNVMVKKKNIPSPVPCKRAVRPRYSVAEGRKANKEVEEGKGNNGDFNPDRVPNPVRIKETSNQTYPVLNLLIVLKVLKCEPVWEKA